MLLKNNKSSNIAYLGVLLGLNQIFIVLSSIIETSTVIFFSAAALVVGIIVVEFETRKGAAFYLSSCILGYVLTFNKIEIITYILFFGLYSLIKYIIEKKCYNPVVEMAIKFLYFNISLVVMYLIVNQFVALKIFWWMVIGAQMAFLLYDYAFIVFINYYINTIRPKLKLRT